jgi:hypothetical protein
LSTTKHTHMPKKSSFATIVPCEKQQPPDWICGSFPSTRPRVYIIDYIVKWAQHSWLGKFNFHLDFRAQSNNIYNSGSGIPRVIQSRLKHQKQGLRRNSFACFSKLSLQQIRRQLYLCILQRKLLFGNFSLTRRFYGRCSPFVWTYFMKYGLIKIN